MQTGFPCDMPPSNWLEQRVKKNMALGHAQSLTPVSKRMSTPGGRQPDPCHWLWAEWCYVTGEVDWAKAKLPERPKDSKKVWKKRQSLTLLAKNASRKGEQQEDPEDGFNKTGHFDGRDVVSAALRLLKAMWPLRQRNGDNLRFRLSDYRRVHS